MSDKTIVDKTIKYIENHLNGDLSLDNISSQLHYSKYHMARVFLEETGYTIYKYIQGRRLTLAAEQLAATKKPIIDISYDAGYNSQQAFTLAFHRLYACTPQEYRKNGIFRPKQIRISVESFVRHQSVTSFMNGGNIAA